MGFLSWWNKNMPGAGAIGDAFKPKGVMTPEQAGFTPGIPGYGQGQQQLDGYLKGGNPYMDASKVGPGSYSTDMRNYITGLQNMAAGRGDSLAERQYKAASDQGMQNASALAASGRGNPGMAAMQAQKGNAQITQGLAQGSATARLQEQMAAQQQLGGALGMADQAEFNRQGLNAQLGQQASSQNQAAFLAMLQQKYGMSADQANNLLGYYQALSAQNTAAMGQPTAGDKALNIFSTLGGLFGGS